MAIVVSGARLVVFRYLGDRHATKHHAVREATRAERWVVHGAQEAQQYRQELIDAVPPMTWSTIFQKAVTFLGRRWLDPVRNDVEAMRTHVDDPKARLVRSSLEGRAIRIEIADSGTILAAGVEPRGLVLSFTLPARRSVV
jgi:hypothetical protein